MSNIIDQIFNHVKSVLRGCVLSSAIRCGYDFKYAAPSIFIRNRWRMV